MLNIIKDLFGIGKDSESIIRVLIEARKKTKGVKNQILYEAQFNTSLILDHYLDRKADAGKVIRHLKTERLARAFDEGFDFRRLKKGSVTEKMTANTPFLKSYTGLDCEGILRRILFHIEQLKLLPELYDIEKTDRVDIRRRMENLGKRYILFARFLKSP
ncbi:MAG TPA: hypothetical protein PLR20_07955 [Syntrophales bacterium]|nr:hypothetical protein [Syntrophales bacterium]HOX95355.1 hypothetical protein [Syntrophales bacterium]HPI56594.1 hypothetical protein [Syntrophales bacterium]HPN24985.1 hypothetical protein [Syntrophales bacterium]HQM29273.1 hypothetical protein [Syntrophales bacterium]